MVSSRQPPTHPSWPCPFSRPNRSSQKKHAPAVSFLCLVFFLVRLACPAWRGVSVESFLLSVPTPAAAQAKTVAALPIPAGFLSPLSLGLVLARSCSFARCGTSCSTRGKETRGSTGPVGMTTVRATCWSGWFISGFMIRATLLIRAGRRSTRVQYRPEHACYY